MYQIFSKPPPNLLLSRDYWMRDDSLRDCFACGKPFTTFRRRHHCRLCGQIFCNECTALVSGARFSVPGQLRMCHLCYLYDYDLSDEEEESAEEPEPVELDAASHSEDDERHVRQVRLSHLVSLHPLSRRKYRRRVIGEAAEPAYGELNHVSTLHLARFLRQTLRQFDVKGKAVWYSALLRVIRSVPALRQDPRAGDAFDATQYIKVKKIPGASPSSLECFLGMVFTKNLALRGMRSKITQPNVLLVDFPLAYLRDQRFVGLSQVEAQEREFLDILVRRVLALEPRPDLVISGREVAGYVLELLCKYGISVLHNVKPLVLGRLLRILDADIVGLIERLATGPKIGACALFEVRLYVHRNVRKTFMFLSGPRSLGCTILLRGADEEGLKRIKNILEFAIYMLFHLRLETSLFRSEFLAMPNADQVLTMLKHTPYTGYCSEFIEALDRKIFLISPTVKVPLPHPLARARAAEYAVTCFVRRYLEELLKTNFREIAREFELVGNNEKHLAAAVHSVAASRAKALRATLKLCCRQWETHQHVIPRLLETSFHQSISYLYATINVKSQRHCIFPRIRTCEYYMDSDMPLGEYIERLIESADHLCEEGCGNIMADHSSSYAHGKGVLSISLERGPQKIPGFSGDILMWSTCRICGHSTPVLPMNELVWKILFGKFLELGFLSIDFEVSFEECAHGFRSRSRRFERNGICVRIEYDEINLLELVVPGDQVAWRPEIDANLKSQIYESMKEKTTSFFKSVLDRLQGVKIDTNQENAGGAREKISELIALAKENETQILASAERVFNETPPVEYLALNKVLKDLQNMSVAWDTRFSEFEEEFLPSETDITRITAFQLGNFFRGGESKDETDKKEEHAEDPDGKLHEKSEIFESEKSEIKKDEQQFDKGQDNNEGVGKVIDLSSLETVELEEYDRNKTNYGSHVEKDQAQGKTERGSVLDKVSQMEAILSQPAHPMTSTSNLLKTELINRTSISKRSHNQRVAQLRDYYDQMHVRLNREFALQREKERRKIATRYRAMPLISSVPTVKIYQDFARQEEAKKGEKKGYEWEEDSDDDSESDVEEVQDPKSNMMVTRIPGRSHSLRNRKLTRSKEEFEGKDKKVKKEAASKQTNEKAKLATIDKTKKVIARNPIKVSYSAQTEVPIKDVEFDLKNKRQTYENKSEDAKSEDAKSEDAESELKKADNAKSENVKAESGRTENNAENVKNEDTRIGNHVTTDQKPDEGKADEIKIDDTKSDSPKITIPEKNSLLSVIRKFWADRSVLWKPLDYPLEQTAHVFLDSDVIVREDEPSLLIAYTLSLSKYVQTVRELGSEEERTLEGDLLSKSPTHVNFLVTEGQAVLTCKVFFVQQFAALREACGSGYIQSLSRCVKWDLTGGKSGLAFLKTLDDRFVIKQLLESERDSFVKMAFGYFGFVARLLFRDLPSLISKIFGFYQILIKNTSNGKNMSMSVIVMENLFYGRKNLRIFDLKGSMRNRHVEQTGRKNEVLLDENMVDYMFESPLFVRLHSKKLLKASLWNDTLFLGKRNVMDYSLVIGIDTESNEIVAGIIDYIRTFTWDKKLESWVKEKGLVGGGGKRPTVVTPKQYKTRFRAAMDKYMLLVPDRFYLEDLLESNFRDK